MRELEPIVAEIASPGMSRQKILRKALTSLGYDQATILFAEGVVSSLTLPQPYEKSS